MFLFYVELDAAARSHFQEIPIDRAPAAYRARLARKTHPQALAQSWAGLWLLERALEHLGCDAGTLADIDFSVYDQPRLAAGPAFSISHCATCAACAVSHAQAVGLDLETLRPIVPARLARLMSAAERATVEREPARFFDYWCAREATIKASGRVGLTRIKQVRLRAGHAMLDERRWPLYPLVLAPGLAGCIASDAPITDVQVNRLSL